MNGDSTIHTSRLWSVSGFIICTNLQGFIYFLTNVKMCSKLNMLSWRLSLMFYLMEVVVWGLKLSCAVLPTSTPTHPASLPNFVVIWEIHIVLLALKMNTGENFKPWMWFSQWSLIPFLSKICAFNCVSANENAVSNTSIDVAIGTNYGHNIGHKILESWVQYSPKIKFNGICRFC